MAWLGLTLLCAISLAFADVGTKVWLSKLGDNERVFIRLALPGMMLAPLAYASLPEQPAWGEFMPWVLVSLPVEVFAMHLYVRALHEGPLSLTLPYMAFTPVFVALTGWLLLEEHVSTEGFAGIALVVLGSWILNSDRQRHPRNVVKAVFEQRGARLMLSVAMLYSITAVTTRGAVRHTDGVFFGAFYLSFVAFTILAWNGLRGIAVWRVMWRGPRTLWLVSGAMGAMVVLHFAALRLIEVASMIAVKRTSLLWGVLIGVIWLGEEAGPRRIIAGAIMVAGAAIVVLAG
ncbi:MAG: EamA family transporter [Gammaproteobacteria bacterium]|nr:EamA family transporter [Gammaproteobacteria bacterium]MCP5135570.1 EamA family transporter [Gammaproteobacteria bacterium]